jgi:hypothetical protein
MRNVVSSFSRRITFLLVIVSMGLLTITNLIFTNANGETCGIVHPYIFQINVSSIDVSTGTKSNAYVTTIPDTDETSGLDTYLRIYDENGTQVASNDDFEGLTSAIVDFPVGQYGTIIIEVATFGDFSSGVYELKVELSSSNLSSANTENASFSATVDGEDITDTREFSGEIPLGTTVTYTLSAPQPVNIALTGMNTETEEQLDTVLRIYDEAGEFIFENDDFDVGSGYSSAVEAFPVQDFGTVTLEVATYNNGSAGTYNLTISPVTESIFSFLGTTPSAANTPDLTYRDATITIGASDSKQIQPSERVRYTLTSEQETDVVHIRLGIAQGERNWDSQYLFMKDNPSVPLQWVSCVDYYGYVNEGSFTLNERGLTRFGQGIGCDPTQEGCSIVSRVNLNFRGQVLLYLLLPGLVILLPIMGVFAIRREKGAALWIIMLVFVAAHVLTSSLVYVHLATASGIEALANFAYGILAGAATGSAIAFMGKVLENFSHGDD